MLRGAASLPACTGPAAFSMLHPLLILTPLPILFQPVPPPAGIKANTRDGVLTVTVPKTEEPKPKSIDVSVE